MPDPVPQPDRVLYLKYWHIVLMLVVQLVGLGMAYGKISQSLDDLTRRVGVMENTKFITRDEYDSWRTDVRDTLARIETEILERNRAEKLLR
jgi:hypothetical protein